MMSQHPRPARDGRAAHAELVMVDQRVLAVNSPVLEDPPLDFAPLPAVSSQLVVFDFDWSLADQDTDRWVHEVLSPRLRIEFVQKKPTMQFTDMWYVPWLTPQRVSAGGAAQGGTLARGDRGGAAVHAHGTRPALTRSIPP